MLAVDRSHKIMEAGYVFAPCPDLILASTTKSVQDAVHQATEAILKEPRLEFNMPEVNVSLL